MHQITRGRVQSRRGAYTQDRIFCILGIYIEVYTYYLGEKSVHVGIQMCTHVYTIVYTRVHYLALSMSSVGLSYVPSSGLTPRRSNGTSKDPLGMQRAPEGRQGRIQKETAPTLRDLSFYSAASIYVRVSISHEPQRRRALRSRASSQVGAW